MKQYEMFELRFPCEAPKDAWAQAEVTAVFTGPMGEVTVGGFYAGPGEIRVRFLPELPGTYCYKIMGAVFEEGIAVCEKADAGRHGIVRADGLHFRHVDGTLYRPYGTTVYALLHQDRALMDTTFATLAGAPFNKIRFCLFPKHYDFNHNEPLYYAFEQTDGKWDVNKPNFAFWDAFEEGLGKLDKLGIQADLILFHPYDRWGFSKLTAEEAGIYLDYLVSRFAAFPNIWWSLSNEFDLCDAYKASDWVNFAKQIAATDPYHHLLSNHNCFEYADFSQPEITHCCIQDINVNEVPELHRQYGKPVVFDECRYEGNIMHNWGNISAKEMVHRFWTAMTYGGYCTHGETYYSEDEVLWWSRGGALKGESAPRIAFLREVMEAIKGPLTVIPEGAGRFSVEQIEEMKRNGIPEEYRDDFFAKGLCRMPKERMLAFMVRNRPALSHFEEQAYLRYYEKECPVKGSLRLPEAGAYRVEIIDTWEMTRTVISENAGGEVSFELPGKEGMAVLAVANNAG